MKKVAGILVVASFAVGMIATQPEQTISFDFDFEDMLTCGDCDRGDLDRDYYFKREKKA